MPPGFRKLDRHDMPERQDWRDLARLDQPHHAGEGGARRAGRLARHLRRRAVRARTRRPPRRARRRAPRRSRPCTRRGAPPQAHPTLEADRAREGRMTDRAVFVYADLDGRAHLVGRLWAHARKGRQSATFEYDPSWLESPGRFALEPALQLGPGAFHTTADKAMFGALGDSAPDRWG